MNRNLEHLLAIANHNRPARYDLKYPITWKSKTITAVTLRWPELNQLQKLQRLGASAEHSFQFIALMTGLPAPAIELFDLEDIAELKIRIDKFAGYEKG